MIREKMMNRVAWWQGQRQNDASSKNLGYNSWLTGNVEKNVANKWGIKPKRWPRCGANRDKKS